MASELEKTQPGDTGKDALRRIAGEQDRVAARAARVQENLKQQAAGAAGLPKGNDTAKTEQAVAAAARDFDQKRVPDRMKQSAEQLRATAEQPDGTNKEQESATAKAAAAAEQDLARELDKLADRLANASGQKDQESQKLADDRTRAGELRGQIDKLGDDLEKLAAPGPNAKPDQKQGAGGTSSTELAQLQQEYSRQLEQARQLLDQLKREDPSMAQGGAGFTFEGQGMTMSAPGTEAFKQDFAKWQQLRQQATQALESAETSLSRRLLAKEARDRLASGVDDKPPAAYETQVDSYFKALATKKKP